MKLQNIIAESWEVKIWSQSRSKMFVLDKHLTVLFGTKSWSNINLESLGLLYLTEVVPLDSF